MKTGSSECYPTLQFEWEIEMETSYKDCDQRDKSYEPDNSENLSDVNLDIGIPNEDRRSQREREKGKSFDDFVTYLTSEKTELSAGVGNPLSLEETLLGPNHDHWVSAMSNEMTNFSKNAAWEIIDLLEASEV